MEIEGIVGSAGAVIPLMTVMVGSLISRFALGVTVIEVVMTEVAVTVSPTLVIVTVCNVTDTGVVVVADVTVTTGVV